MTFGEQIAARQIQRMWRGHHARKKYGVKQLSDAQSVSGQTYAVGNDPKIKGLEAHAIGEGKIALIGTSGLRALALALELNHSERTPKIIIVDNSRLVIQFWRKLRDMLEIKKPVTDADFIRCIKAFFQDNLALYRDSKPDALTIYNTPAHEYENQDPVVYLTFLIEEHGIQRVVNAIKHTSIIQNTWTDPTVFFKLRNICELNGVTKMIVYPSNIAHCVRSVTERYRVFESIEQLSPDLSIITDVCIFHGIPERVILTTEKSGAEIKKQVFGARMDASARVSLMNDPRFLMLLLMMGGDFRSQPPASYVPSDCFHFN